MNKLCKQYSYSLIGALSIFYVIALIKFQGFAFFYLSSNTAEEYYPRPSANANNPQENKINKYNIFFLETNKKRQFLDIRAQCAIESAAFNNPNANVYLYSLKAKFDQNTILTKIYSNIKLIYLEPYKVFDNTYFKRWWKKSKNLLFKGNHPIEHLSDGLRLALLYKYGGVYSDSDTITIQSFETLIAQSQSGVSCSNDYQLNPVEINNAFLIFTKKNFVLEKFIENFVASYNPYVWSANGPQLIMRVLYKECNLSLDDCRINISQKNRVISSKCGNMTLFPYFFFNAIPYFQANELFTNSSTVPIHLFNNSYSIHFFSAITKKLKVYPNSNNIYEFFARKNCPVTYAKIIANPSENY